MTKAIALSEGQTAELTDYKAPSGLIRRGLDDIPQALLSLPRIHRVPIDFPTIQAAVDSANEDDVIELLPGEYEENLCIVKGIVIRPSIGQVRLQTRDEAKPLFLVNIGQGSLFIEGITLAGKAGTFWKPQNAIQIERGIVQLKDSVVVGWKTTDFGPDFPDDVWQQHRYYQTWELSRAIVVSTDSSSLEMRNCKVYDCDIGVVVEGGASTTMCDCTFDDLESAIEVSSGAMATICRSNITGVHYSLGIHDGSVISQDNTFVDTGVLMWTGQKARVESRFDSLIDATSLLGVGNSGDSIIIFDHATIRSRTLMGLTIGEGLVEPDSNGTWRWHAPHISVGDSIVVLKEDGFEHHYAPAALLSWGLPQIDVWSCVDFVRKNIVCVPPRISDPDPMFADIENGRLRLKSGSPALGAASDGTNLGAWQGTAQ